MENAEADKLIAATDRIVAHLSPGELVGLARRLDRYRALDRARVAAYGDVLAFVTGALADRHPDAETIRLLRTLEGMRAAVVAAIPAKGR